MRSIRNSVLFTTTALSLAAITPAYAQEERQASEDVEEAVSTNDIIVTARRTEERLQDVPISISVLSQEQLTQNNVSNVRDIAALTPGLQINSRNGADATTFNIRGFSQEARTYATVGTYFADVVAPRGSGATAGGDGAGPGSLFDLQNIQVLKGPQGTLQGRNSTGGAVLLVPKKPVDRFEGYIEAAIGDFDTRRVQAVVNIPVRDNFLVRIGGERHLRDGYLKNVGNLCDGRNGCNKGMGDIDYWTGRLSVVADLTPDLENYTIASYTKSESNGIIPKLRRCTPGAAFSGIPFGNLACAQIAREAPFGKFAVSNRLPDSFSGVEQWQLINTVTWQASDALTIKNILAYGEYRGITNLELFGTYFLNPAVTPGTETMGSQVNGFAFTHAEPFRGFTNAQSSFVAELQFQGRLGGDRLVWQAGLYTEHNDPLGFSGVQTATGTACNDITVYNCAIVPGFSGVSASFQLSSSKFRDYAAYAQATYAITDELKFTGGIRYTRDEQKSRLNLVNVRLSDLTGTCANPIGTGIPTSFRFPVSQRLSACPQKLGTSDEAPTWLLGLDYKPIEDILLYAKWSRGYRQGGLALFGPDTIQEFKSEKVDTYEVGAKASWHGAFPGSFNISAYYNNFTDQQLSVGVTDTILPNPGGLPQQGTSATVLNVGKSRLKGLEAKLNVRPFEGLRVSAAYAYLNTKILKLVPVTLPASSPFDTVTIAAQGGVIPNSQPHKVNVSANYTLPLPNSIGEVSFGGTYIYTAKYRSVVDSCPVLPTAGCIVADAGVGILPATNVLNINANWNNVLGQPIDASVFVTNVTNEVVYLTANANLGNRGFVSSLIGEPRIFGARVRYRFGE